MNEAIEDIRNRVMHKPALTISRMDEKTKEIFTALAKREFCDDYGMTLKWLIERNILFEQLMYLEGKIAMIEKRLNELELGKQIRIIKTVGGKEIRLGEKNDNGAS